jgi:dihydroorotate dehydrogenase electron transfer subunit
MTAPRDHRGTIFVEDGEIIDQRSYPAEQFVLRVRAPRCAAAARPGSFAHITCSPGLPMRRPLSIMAADPDNGIVDFLYKIVGHGLASLARRSVGEKVSVLGPIGQPFRPDPARPHSLLLGGGVGIPPMMFLAERLKKDRSAIWDPIVFMGSEVPFPFDLMTPGPLAGLPASADAALAELEHLGVPSRLASTAGLEGCYGGFVTELAAEWLRGLTPGELERVAVFACGPTPMLAATAELARRFELPCQVSLEEYMACAVGGCAGCAVPVRTPEGLAMKRVCVDGPVFDAETVFPPAA